MEQTFVSIAEARVHLRLGDDLSQDDHICLCLDAALEIAERETNRNFKEDFSSDDFPKSLKIAVLMIAAQLFDSESDFVVGKSVSMLPITITRLLESHRNPPYGAL